MCASTFLGRQPKTTTTTTITTIIQLNNGNKLFGWETTTLSRLSSAVGLFNALKVVHQVVPGAGAHVGKVVGAEDGLTFDLLDLALVAQN